VGAEMLHADGQTSMTKVDIRFSQFCQRKFLSYDTFMRFT